jgi:hypothetical protein
MRSTECVCQPTHGATRGAHAIHSRTAIMVWRINRVTNACAPCVARDVSSKVHGECGRKCTRRRNA